MRPLATAEHELTFWIGHTRVGIWLSVAAVANNAVYYALTWGQFQRPLAMIQSIVVLLFTLALFRLPWPAILRHPRALLVFYSWSGAIVIQITLGALLDGGTSSPLLLTYVLPLMYGAMAYPPKGMIILGASVVTSLALLALLTRDVDAGTLIHQAGGLAITAGLCALIARNHWRQYGEQAELARRLREIAHVDGLTGCLNHRAFHERLAAEVERALRQGTRVALLMADIDHFKLVNDDHGHPVGDAVLARVGATLRHCVQPEVEVARLGGEEFAVLLTDVTRAQAAAVAERIRAAIAAGDEPAHVTVSVGISELAHPGDPRTLLEQADQALYRAKRAGRDQVVHYRDALGQEDRGEVRRAVDRPGTLPARTVVERAIAGRLLATVFQPVVKLSDAEVIGYEALSRFTASDLPTPEGLDLAERLGLRDALERVMWEVALEAVEAGEWQSEWVLFLDASPGALLSGALTGLQHRLPDRVALQVSERYPVQDYGRLTAALRGWTAAGVRVAVADMGAGHANLNHVLHLAPRYLKLDQALVAGVQSDSRRAALIASLVRFAAESGSSLVAEGVEAAEEADVLRALGVEHAQGYLFGRPAASPPPVGWRPHLERQA